MTDVRYKELDSKIALLDRSKLRFGKLVSGFLSTVEKEMIERLYMENQDKAYDTYAKAYYTIKAPNGRKLNFEANIEDNGGFSNLKTPYDERDGAFADLSDCLIVEDRR